MDIILIAGLRLRRSVWSPVCTDLERLGHRPHSVALPGVDGPDHDATLHDQLSAVLTIIDRRSDAVVVVGHSAAASLAWMAADRRPECVQAVVLIGGFP